MKVIRLISMVFLFTLCHSLITAEEIYFKSTYQIQSQEEQEILKQFINSAPNTLTVKSIKRKLPNVPSDTIDKFLKSLLDKGALFSRDEGVYRLSSYKNIPIREYISFGDFQIPRLLDNTTARAEDINYLIESLASYVLTLQKQSEKRILDERNKYWVDTITFFGLFIAIFSLIIGFKDNIKITDPSIGYGKIFLYRLVQISPLAIVLFVFIILLRLLY